ncbi:MAG: hypothetical protein IPF98_15620 [Gemmatimonadetes bacterium]|nr:hypothetical protein [Gemmatimonadota bacterium]MCC6770084.1 hypothetical protein [Gemmatimonadaceae bacterium]
MHWSKMVLAAGAVALSLMGCSDRLAAPDRGEAEHVRLSQQVQELAGRVAQSGAMTAEHERELEEIGGKILDWQRRTGRTDFSIRTSRPLPPATTGLISRPQPPPSCVPCPPTKVSGGMLCFLISGNCIGTGGSRVCAYQCIYGLALATPPELVQ